MTLSFNVSVAGNKSFLSKYLQPMQIMPQQRKTITASMLETFPEIKRKRIACVHTSYVTRPFGEKFLVPGFQQINIVNYLELAKKIGFSNVLVHGPESMKEWTLLEPSLQILHELEQRVKDPTVIIEMPAFKGNFINELKGLMARDESYEKKKPEEITVKDYISYYFDHIVSHNFDIVLDTAHLHANGCTVDDMLFLFKRYEKSMKIVHLNGNKNKMYTSDAHCPMFSERNTIKDVDKLMRYLSSTSLVLITENATEGAEYKQWQQFAEKYKLKIIPEHPNLNC